MDYKAILEGQIEILQRLQDENISSISNQKLDNVVRIAGQIRRLCEDAKHLA